MRRCVVVAAFTLGLAASAAAAPHKVLVLPVDGNADAATRTKLTAHIVRLAKGLDGEVGAAEATFADTALAVGCDPRAPRCSDEVIATLGVDELIWGTATRDGGQTRLVVRRASRGTAAREVSTTVAAGEPGERIDARLAPVFAASAMAEPPSKAPEPAVARPAPPGPDAAVPTPAAPAGPGLAPVPAPPRPAEDHRDRNLGIALAAGGGVSLVLGISLLASYASLQDQIDNHATHNRADFDDLAALEDRASRYAIAGDIAVVVGLAAGGLGAYYLVRSHRRHRMTVALMPLAHGAGLTLTMPGGL
jgi:hypothetical protein